MLKDFVNPTHLLHENYLREGQHRAEVEALRQEAKAHRLRNALGHRLIALGERLVENPSSERAILDRAA